MDGPPNVSSLRVSREILGLIAEIDEFKGAWLAIGRLAPERLSRLRHVAIIESVGSSTRIEGARLSDPEVEQLLSAVEVGSFATRDEQEVAGYADTMNTVFTAWEVIDLTENHIRQLHRDLLQYSEKDERHRGSYKTLPNHVEAFGPGGTRLGVVFETAAPFDTPRLTAELLAWIRTGLTRPAELHPLLVIAVFVVAFLAIHPFQDGNGRLSRILTTLLLLRAGYAYVPYCSLESVIERSRDAYYLALRRTQRTLRTAEPDWAPWLTYFLTALQRQKAASARENRARAPDDRRPARALASDSAAWPRPRARDHPRRGGGDRREPEHDQGPREDVDPQRATDAARLRPRHVGTRRPDSRMAPRGAAGSNDPEPV